MKKVPKLRFKEFSNEWEEKRLGEIGEIIGGGTPSSIIEEYWNGNIQWFTPSEIGKNKYVNKSLRTITKEGLENSSAKLLPKGTILLSSRATIGEKSIALGEVTTNQGFQSIFVNEKNYNEFIYYLLDRIKPELIKKSTGSTFLEISNKTLKEVYIKVTILEEQEKIANFLSSIDKKISLTEEKLELFREYKRGVMQKIFSQELRFKDSNGNDYPEWEEKRLGELGKFYRGHSYNSNNVVEKGVLVLRSNNIQNNKINYNDLQFVNKECKEEIILKDKDIIICMANGSKNLVGKAGEYKLNDNFEKITVGAFCSIFRSRNILSKFLFQTQKYTDEILLMLEGTNINNLKNSVLEEINFYIPFSLEEQQKIADFLSSIDSKIESIEKELEELKEFKKGLLQQMFV